MVGFHEMSCCLIMTIRYPILIINFVSIPLKYSVDKNSTLSLSKPDSYTKSCRLTKLKCTLVYHKTKDMIILLTNICKNGNMDFLFRVIPGRKRTALVTFIQHKIQKQCFPIPRFFVILINKLLPYFFQIGFGFNNMIYF